LIISQMKTVLRDLKASVEHVNDAAKRQRLSSVIDRINRQLTARRSVIPQN
jgi:hypothetical protein